MIDLILRYIAPHHCYGCGSTDCVLCIDCKNYITYESSSSCIACFKNIALASGLCVSCKTFYDRAWYIGEYNGSLKDAIWAYKFNYCKQAYKDFVDLLDSSLPLLPGDIIVTAVPTAPSHIRQRGYDHIELIAKQFAKTRGLKYSRTLHRNGTFRQREANYRLRHKQAKIAYSPKFVQPKRYLLIDDVVTTGATINCASKVLLDSGANQVWVAALARQTLD